MSLLPDSHQSRSFHTISISFNVNPSTVIVLPCTKSVNITFTHNLKPFNRIPWFFTPSRPINKKLYKVL
jgi:hypothetical protein